MDLLRYLWLVAQILFGTAPPPPDRSTPCGTGDHAARDVFDRLWIGFGGDGENGAIIPDAVRFGTCTVDKGVIRDAGGRELGTLGCGIDVKTPGWVDHLGVRVGDRGQQVIDRESWAPYALRCGDVGNGRVWCSYQSFETDGGSLGAYLVAGDLHGTELTGADAVEYFERRRIIEYALQFHCH